MFDVVNKRNVKITYQNCEAMPPESALICVMHEDSSKNGHIEISVSGEGFINLEIVAKEDQSN